MPPPVIFSLVEVSGPAGGVVDAVVSPVIFSLAEGLLVRGSLLLGDTVVTSVGYPD